MSLIWLKFLHVLSIFSFASLRYVLMRLTPVFICDFINSNTYHNFQITMMAEIVMASDDIGLIAYHTSKIIGGTIFGIEKLLSYNSYLMLTNPFMLIGLTVMVYVLRYFYKDTEPTNILYMLVVFNWLFNVILTGNVYHIIGALIYTVTDFDVAMYDCGIFKEFLLPAYYFGLLLLTR